MPALQGQQKRQAVVPDLHPRLQAALERDGVTLTKLAQVVGLDVRTVARWGSEDEYGSRAAAFRRLEDVIAGRARIVETELGAPVLEELGEGVAFATIAKLQDDFRVWREQLSDALDAFGDTLAGLTAQRIEGVTESSFSEKSMTGPLQPESELGTVATMNASLLKDVAQDIRTRSKGQMVLFSQKVQPDFQARLEEAARRWNMKPSDVLRALVECQLPAPSSDSQ